MWSCEKADWSSLLVTKNKRGIWHKYRANSKLDLIETWILWNIFKINRTKRSVSFQCDASDRVDNKKTTDYSVHIQNLSVAYTERLLCKYYISLTGVQSVPQLLQESTNMKTCSVCLQH